MNRSILALCMVTLCAFTVYAQRTETQGQAGSDISATASKTGKNIDIASGTRLAAELQSTVDVRKARVGDQVVLKTTQAIKSEGQTVVNKGARMIGHVTEVAQKTKSNSTSRVGLVFDRLENGALAFPISATITSVLSGRASARSGDDDLFASDAAAMSSTSARSSSNSQSSGLLGGVTNTAGAVVNTTTSAAGTVVGNTTNTVNGTTSGLTRSLGGIQISESSSTSTEGGAVLSLPGDNLRLEKGTRFNLVLNQTATVSTTRQQ